jgi:membrane protein YdbS with pleckstrin-like domain
MAPGDRMAPAAPGEPRGAERVLWEGTPSAKALVGAIAAAALFAAVLGLAAYLAYHPLLTFVAGLSPDVRREVTRHRDDIFLVLVGLVVLLVLGRLLRLGWRLAVLKSHRYRITDQRMVIESGVLSRRIDELDMRTVEDLEFQQSVVERLLGIGDITVISSDRSSARTRLVGLARPRELRELIRGSAYQATHGQLFTRQT